MAIRDSEQNGYIIETDSGHVVADIVIFALGFRPNTEAFDLPKAANCALLADEYGADAHIYVVGDCAEVHHLALGQSVYVPLATTANK